jgi:hypothetical protein
MDKATVDETREAKKGWWLRKVTNSLASTKWAALQRLKGRPKPPLMHSGPV